MPSQKGKQAQPFGDHVRELRYRVFVCVFVMLLGSLIGYGIHEKLFTILRKPLHSQLYYTTPTGGFNAIIKISIVFGFIVTVPVIMFQLGKFLSPAFKRRYKAVPIILFSSFLAILGVIFAYYLSLPAALHFLANVDTKNLQALINVNDYLSFVFAYLMAFAILFQLPLLLLFINRITPLKPGRLMKLQRWVILISFILAAVLTPTPDPMNQAIMALPIILLYQFSVIVVWLSNSSPKAKARRAREAAEYQQELDAALAAEAAENRATETEVSSGPLVPAMTAYSSASYSGQTAFPSTLPQASASSSPALINDIYNRT